MESSAFQEHSRVQYWLQHSHRPWSGGIPSAENEWMSKYINWSIFLVACFSHPLWLLFLWKCWEMCKMWHGSDHLPFLLIEQMNIMHPQHAGFINIANAGLPREGHNLGIYFNLHYRCTECWLLFIAWRHTCINKKKSSYGYYISSLRTKKDMYFIKYVTGRNVFTFFSESAPNSDCIIQDPRLICLLLPACLSAQVEKYWHW